MGLRILALLVVSLVEEGGVWRLPVNELGEACEFPLDPLLRAGAPLGQYHCPYCGGMQVAGVPHLDWSDEMFADLGGDEGELIEVTCGPLF